MTGSQAGRRCDIPHCVHHRVDARLRDGRSCAGSGGERRGACHVVVRAGGQTRRPHRVLRANLDAQREYATRDRVGDGVLQYARKLGSSPGKQDGLYWPADPARGEEPSPFGPLIAASSQHFKDRKAGDAYHGYHFRILTKQGKNAPGGAFSYLINGRMRAGFAMAASPAQYGESGVMTFIVNNNGVVYQKNRGASAPPLTEFDPDASWTRVQDP
ncbi:DUF2950 family protein [Caballeronia sp. LZ025]|nr:MULTISPECIES: DUF2950 family protein [Caballeronia]MDR5734806.1 DUF2950 family protein [Caballeronia sp. LZ025]